MRGIVDDDVETVRRMRLAHFRQSSGVPLIRGFEPHVGMRTEVDVTIIDVDADDRAVREIAAEGLQRFAARDAELEQCDWLIAERREVLIVQLVDSWRRELRLRVCLGRVTPCQLAQRHYRTFVTFLCHGVKDLHSLLGPVEGTLLGADRLNSNVWPISRDSDHALQEPSPLNHGPAAATVDHAGFPFGAGVHFSHLRSHPVLPPTYVFVHS